MKKNIKKILSLACAFSLLLSLNGCGETVASSYGSYELTPKVYYGPNTPDGSASYAKDETSQLTEADIQKMNNGKARFVYGNEGYVSFLTGRFSDKKVNDHEDAIAALQRVAGLIGLGAGSEFFASHGSRDSHGYTYYTFQQRYGENTVLYSALTVIVDPDGYTAGLTCSFLPNIGIAQETEDIGPDKALEVIKEAFAKYNLTFYPENTHKVAVAKNGNIYNAYAIYSNNPDSTGMEFDLRYYEFFVTTSGQILNFYPVASMGTGNLDATRAEDYFKNLETMNKTIMVTRWDGTKETLTVPVSYNSTSKTWYLADNKRKIAVGLYNDIANYNITTLITSSNGEDWRNQDLLAYDRYIKAYDYYAALGLYSVDGVGVPILVCTQMPDNNACFFGIHAGWACFGASDLNVYSEGMDVVGHEYTHGVFDSSMTSNKYLGITGAINESYAD
ncbi:MAG: hypothetical protein IKZ39_00240, partial [Lachnospiraceae bacterium]|nr:hypothetical protein [Lachnospiraceae bacterium]